MGELNTLRWSKGRMWNNVTVLEEHISGTPHQVGTPLENSGTPWGVRYTRLTCTGLTTYGCALWCTRIVHTTAFYFATEYSDVTVFVWGRVHATILSYFTWPL